MITILKSEVNTVDLTLNDMVTIDAPIYFLFRVYSDVSDYEKVFLCTDETGGLIDRYNRFLIEETTSEDLTDGKVTLRTGQYTCDVYAQNSPTNLDYELADELIKSDLLDVIDSAVVINTAYQPTVDIKTPYRPS